MKTCLPIVRIDAVEFHLILRSMNVNCDKKK